MICSKRLRKVSCPLSAIAAIAFFCLVTAHEVGAGAKALVNKATLTLAGTMSIEALPVATIQKLGASVVEEYDDMAVVDLGPTTATALAQATGLLVSPLPDHDKVLLHAYTLLSAGLPPELETPPFPDGTANLYLVVFRSIPKAEWVARLEDIAQIISYVPSNTYLVYAPLAEIKGKRLQQPEITNVLPFLPEFKHLDWEHLSGESGFARVLVRVVKGAVSEPIIDLIQATALPETFGRFELDTTTAVIGELPNDVVQGLVFHPEVVLIEPAPGLTPSGERQALVVAGELTSAYEGGRTVYKPQCATEYYSWLAGKGLGNLSAVHLGFLDTGLDVGYTADVHADFLNSSGASRVDYNGVYYGPTCNRNQPPSATNVCPFDCTGHGTLVAAVMVGAGGLSFYNTQLNEATSPCTGSNRFWSGAGVAPTARIHSWKIWDDANSPNQWANMPSRVTNGIANLAAQGVKIANLSSNDSSDNSYTSFSTLLDQRVRDASGIGFRLPMTITVSAGNSQTFAAVTSPATAKNVISVGASENYNGFSGADSCGTFDYANNAYDIAWFSRSGSRTDTADFNPEDPNSRDYRWKPDLVAPGTRIMGAASRQISAQPHSTYWEDCWFHGTCVKYLFDPPSLPSNIAWSAGTSFAAPGTAGAAALVEKWYSNTHSSLWPSPAMVKAMLVNSARDIVGGMFNSVSVDHIPSWYQGFGKVDLGRAFPASGNYYDLDQTWSFTTSGSNLWVRSFTVRDGTKPVYITLVWTDAPGFGGSGYALKNDLDVYVDAPMANSHFVGNSFSETTGQSIRYTGGQIPFDNRNNVEEIVFVPNSYGIVGFWVTVFPRTISEGSQDFAIFVTNAY
jgi:hypothetical protein